MSHPLADAIREAIDARPDPIRVGVVDGTSPLTVALGGTSGIEVSKAASYTSPSTDDIVLVIATETDWCAICKITPG